MASSMLSLSTSCNLKCASTNGRFCKVSPFGEQAPTMASRIPSPKIGQSPPRASTRRRVTTQASFSPFPELNSRLVELHTSFYQNLVSIATAFVAPDNPEIHKSHHVGAGTYFDPTLVVTSAQAVGRVSAVPDPDGGSPLYKAYIGSTFGFTSGDINPVKLTLLAVSFGSDVAVLKVDEESSPLQVFPLAAGPPPEMDSILMSECYNQDIGWAVSVANVRAVEQKKTIKAKAPWPLDDEAAWIEFDWMVFRRGPPPASSVLFNCKEKISGSITTMSGSPWFNLYGELVGIASWVFRDDPASFSVGYASPVSSIRPVVHYAKTKCPDDPVVMDHWIHSEEVAGDVAVSFIVKKN